MWRYNNWEWRWKLQRIHYSVPKFHELCLQTPIHRTFIICPPSLSDICCFLASLRKERSPSRIQPIFATCWEVNQICKRTWKIEWFLPCKWGSKTAYFPTVFNSTKLCQMPRNRTGVLTRALEACSETVYYTPFHRRQSPQNFHFLTPVPAKYIFILIPSRLCSN